MDLPAKLVHLVDNIKADAIANDYYEDVENSKYQQFVGINSEKAKELERIYHIDIIENQTYVFDISSQSYIILDDNIEKRFSESKLEAINTVLFGYMGATSVNGKITEISKKELKKDINGNLTFKAFDLSAEYKREILENFSKTIFIENKDPNNKRNIKTYDETKDYLQKTGLITDSSLKGRLEELRNNPDRGGTYCKKISLTHDLEKAWELGAKVSVTPIFKANLKLQERCKYITEVYFELNVSFD